jgi:hypothetical protein
MSEHRRSGSFVVCAPDGMLYWPPVSMNEARRTISQRSLYAGEPGWEVLPAWLALDHEKSNLREVH